jgi:hypothetical protein
MYKLIESNVKYWINLNINLKYLSLIYKPML